MHLLTVTQSEELVLKIMVFTVNMQSKKHDQVHVKVVIVILSSCNPRDHVTFPT